MSIWTDKFIFNSPIVYDDFNDKASEVESVPSIKSTNVAIVGGGIKGFIHLLDTISEYREDSEPELEIHWFDKRGRFANGKEFCVEQPEFKLALCPVGKIDLIQSVWEHSSISTPDYLNIFKWLNNKLEDLSLKAVPFDWISKRVLGLYLQEMLKELQEIVPGSISIYFHTAEVKHICTDSGSVQLEYARDWKPVNLVFKEIKVGLETYAINRLVDEKSHIIFSASSRSAFYYGNPKRNCDAFKAIRLTDQVVISATNEYFYDCLFSVTEGRGGKFEIEGGDLKYIKSGNEPLSIFPFFPFGLPFLPDPYVKPQPYRFKSLTNKWEDELLERAKSSTIHFEDDIFKYFIQELILVAENKEIDVSGNILDSYLSYLHESQTSRAGEFHQETVESLKKTIVGNPCKYAYLLSVMWNKITSVIARILMLKGFSDGLYDEFCVMYKDKLDWLTLKVPPLYIWKILALAEARIVFFRLGSDTVVNGDLIRGKFIASSYQAKYDKHSNIYINTAGFFNPNVETDSSIFHYLSGEKQASDG